MPETRARDEHGQCEGRTRHAAVTLAVGLVGGMAVGAGIGVLIGDIPMGLGIGAAMGCGAGGVLASLIVAGDL